MSYTDEQIHEKWVKWLEAMDKHVKHDVYLYRMKIIHEQHIENPRLYPNQEVLVSSLPIFSNTTAA